MASSKLQRICLTRFSHPAGLLGRRVETEECLRLFYEGGTVTVSQAAVEGTGSSWKLLKKRLYLSARDKGIPFEDRR